MNKVNAAVKEVFGPVNPREDVTLERLSAMILEVRKKVEGATEAERQDHKWLSYLLPPREQEDFVLQESGMNEAPSPEPQDNPNDPLLQSSSTSATLNPSLRRLLDETSDLIDSPTFTHVLTLLLNTTFSHLIDQRIAVEAFKLGNPTDSTTRIVDISAKCKLAQTLAVFCRQAHVIAAGSSEPDDLAAASLIGDGAQGANEYLAQIDRVKDLEGFAAVIYSSNFEFEAVEDEGVAAPPEPVPASVPISAVAPELVAEEITKEDAIELPKVLQESLMASEELVKIAAEEPVTEQPVAEEPVPEKSAPVETAPQQPSSEGPITITTASGEEKQVEREAEIQQLETQAASQGFESAWEKALATEDGKTEPST